MHAVPTHGKVLVRELECTPALLRQLAAQYPDNFPLLLDSAVAGPLGRYCILAAYPRLTLWQDARGVVRAGDTVIHGHDFLGVFEQYWRAEAGAVASANAPDIQTASAWPFRGGWMVYLGYECAREIEPLLTLPAPDVAVAAAALRVPAALLFDHERGCGCVIAEPGEEATLTRLVDLVQVVSSKPMGSPEPVPPCEPMFAVEEEAPERFCERVRSALDYIHAGDIYQANLSRLWRVQTPQAPDVAALYRQLCAANPAPFAASLRLGGFAVLSSSPERLVRVQADRIETRPIAGTRARSGRPGADAGEIERLIGNVKERAEHVMLIDLERNDLGRVSRPGSVRADQFMHIESYAHVHHIVSNVSGQLRARTTPVEVLRALFPGGTITGCPKFRCMQIIAELEAQPRNAYTGTLGYINHDGSMDCNILIRTLMVDGNDISFRAGAGIVADSDPVRELAETRAKARGLLAALGTRIAA